MILHDGEESKQPRCQKLLHRTDVHELSVEDRKHEIAINFLYSLYGLTLWGEPPGHLTSEYILKPQEELEYMAGCSDGKLIRSL